MTIHPDDVPDFLALFENFGCSPGPYSVQKCLSVTTVKCEEIEFIYDCGVRGAPCPEASPMGKKVVFYWPDISWAEWEDARTYYEDTEE